MKHKELTTNPFPRSVRVEDDRRGGSAVEQASSTSNGVRRWWKDSGRGEAGLGVWEGGGGAEECSHARNQGLMDGGGRSKQGATMARELELRLALEGKRKKRGLTSGSHGHPDKYLGDASRTVRRYLADCPRGGCYRNDIKPFTICHLLLNKAVASY